jgi:hypothetical protein
MTDGVIVILEGVPHVQTTHTSWDEPVRLYHYWPLPGATGKVEDGDRVHSSSGGMEIVQTRMGSRRFWLPQGGDTKAALVDEEPVPPPRTRLETRWHQGSWEKKTSKGWVVAYARPNPGERIWYLDAPGSGRYFARKTGRPPKSKPWELVPTPWQLGDTERFKTLTALKMAYPGQWRLAGPR